MVYVRDNQIESFGYPYYVSHPAQQLLDIGHQSDYIQSIPNDLRVKIIDENNLLHKIVEKERNKNIIEGIIQEYKVKYNVVIAQGEEFEASRPRISNYENFTLFLYSMGEMDFMKFHLFEMCLLDKAEVFCALILDDSQVIDRKRSSAKIFAEGFSQKNEGKNGFETLCY